MEGKNNWLEEKGKINEQKKIMAETKERKNT